MCDNLRPPHCSLLKTLPPKGPATEVADAPPAAAAIATTPTVRTVQEQVMAATALAENVSAADTGHEANNSAAPQNNVNNLVALLITSGDIQSVSDLDNKDLAIEREQSVPRAIIEIALAAAGAPEVRLSEGQTKPVDRVTQRRSACRASDLGLPRGGGVVSGYQGL